MASSKSRVKSESGAQVSRFRYVRGSERAALPGAHLIGPIDPNLCIEVTVLLRRRRHGAGERVVSADELGSKLPLKRQYLTRESVVISHSADPADVEDVAAFASRNGLRVTGHNVPARTLHLTGIVANFSKAFDVRLFRYRHRGGSYRGRVGPVSIPAALEGVIQGVFGLDNRPAAKPKFLPRRELGGAWPRLEAESFSAVDVAKMYSFPTNVTGAGQCIGIIELGGGFRRPDLNVYFKQLGITTPQVVPVHVLGRRNVPTGNPYGLDGEVMLDIEVAGAVAPDARIAVYFAPNTDQGFLRAVNRAIHDNVNKPTVLVISWGYPEQAWTHQSLNAINAAFQTAAQLGITVCVASGDAGATDGVPGALAHVDFPASSPYALACGGTYILAVFDSLLGEYVWNNGPNAATGGGISDFFPLPGWQSHAGIPPSINPGARIGRGIPDVAANASELSGYAVRVDGVDVVLGGTSAAAPLWGGLIALINEGLNTTVGYINPALYSSIGASSAFRDITQGNNGTGTNAGYSAGPGWDACTGFGAPNGATLATALQAATPQHTRAASHAAAAPTRAVKARAKKRSARRK